MATIDHVIVLVLENRSFDHMLGFLEHPDPDFDGLTRGGPYENPGWDSGPAVAATSQAKRVLPVDPDHSHDAVMEQLAVQGVGQARQATNQGFVVGYERAGRGLNPPAFGGLLAPLVQWWTRRRRAKPAIENRGPLAMLCQPPHHVPVLSRLALEFGVCTRWFCSVPGETWPNRNFLHAATSDGEVNIAVRPFIDRTIFELLEDHATTWRIYYDDTPQVWAFPQLWATAERHANWYRFAEFERHVAAGTLPAYSFIEPNHRPPVHFVDNIPIVGRRDVSNSQHPGNNTVPNDAYDTYDDDHDSDFARGEALVATIYEALRANPDVFERSLLLITYDEHGGFYDHVPPPIGVPNPGDPPAWFRRLVRLLFHRKAKAFDFTMLGARVPAVVVSPYVPRGTVDKQVRDHASVPATLRALFAPGARPLTARDAWSAPFHTMLTLDRPRADLPDLSGHTTAPSEPAAGVATVATTPSQVTAVMPSYYRDFSAQAELVLEHLQDLGEPEATAAVPPGGIPRSVEITDVFETAALRHRNDLDG